MYQELQASVWDKPQKHTIELRMGSEGRRIYVVCHFMQKVSKRGN